MVDLKKFLSFFLLTAALTSSIVAILTGFNDRRPETQELTSAQNLKEASQETTNLSSGNAFTELMPDSNQNSAKTATINNEDLPQVTYSSNLTENLSQQLTRELVRSNPQGPESEGDGYNFITPPDGAINKIGRLSMIGMDWEGDEKENQFKVIDNADREEEVSYLKGVDQIIGGATAGEEFKNLNTQETSWETVVATQLVLSETEKKLEAMSVPKSMLELHKSIIASISNQKKIFESLSSYEEDPLKTLVVFENADQIINQDLARLSEEYEKLNLPKDALGLSGEGMKLSFLDKFLGVKEAKAQLWVPIDCVGFQCVKKLLIAIKDLAQKIWEWGRKFATEQLKNRLVKSMVRQTINWIQGGSKPKFVENWNDFLSDNADRAAGYIISNVEPKLCRSFGPLVKVLLYPPQSTRGSNLQIKTQCTLSQVISNIDSFRENFAEGGWIGYSYALKPQNNLFGTLIEVGDTSLREAEKAKEAANAQAQAGQGFTTEKVCGDTRVHNVSEIWDYVAGPPPPGYVGTEGEAIFIAGQLGEDYVPDSFKKLRGGDFETCPPRAWQNTTPGSAIAHSLYTALDAPLHRIVNAQDLIDLMSALVDSALNKLMHAGAEGLRNLVSGERFTPGVTPGGAPAGDPATLCDGLTGTDLSSCMIDATETNRINNSSSTAPGAGTPSCQGLSGQALQNCINNAAGSASTTAPAVNLPPVVTIDGPSTVTANAILTPWWRIIGSDPDDPAGATVIIYDIDWGDGNVTLNVTERSGQTVTKYHNYTRPIPGDPPINLVIKVIATDISGATTTATKAVEVRPL